MIQNAETKSDAYTVLSLDAVWTSEFAAHQWIDRLPTDQFPLRKMLKPVVETAKYRGGLYAAPASSDGGLLYYRTDLVPRPPRTYDDLRQSARAAMERDPRLAGFLWQGRQYEGLNCNVFEAVWGHGGELLRDGRIALDTPAARAALQWLRETITTGLSPKSVISSAEEETRRAFQDGRAVFLRNWPYVYSLASTDASSKVKGKFAVTVLPHGAKGPSVGTVGGWQLGVSKFSKHKNAAIEFVRYATSAPVETWNATQYSLVPTRIAVAKNKAVVKANPYLKPAIASVPRVTRPAKFLKGKYNSGSKVIYQGINQILRGTPAKNVLPSIKSRLERLLR
jgi:multiple sugar transport system substrate-binding protein